MDPDTLQMIVIFGAATVITVVSLAFRHAKMIAEIDAKKAMSSQGDESLRREVAELKSMVGDMMLQMEYQKDFQAESVQERLSPPEFKQRT